MNYPRIIDIKPLENMKLLVKFETGVYKLMDIKPYLDIFEPFKELIDKNIFDSVTIDKLGRGIIWNERVDLDAFDVWQNGQDYN
ncbi:MAG: DUF2442 domain-containing protein [Endomicrobium sp.]|jgi:hypothetical protein|nr:DUF2442 domain-containing protein [Endomicrobium sp.]